MVLTCETSREYLSVHIRIIIDMYNCTTIAVAKESDECCLARSVPDNSYRMLPYMYDFVMASFTVYVSKQVQNVNVSANERRISV